MQSLVDKKVDLVLSIANPATQAVYKDKTTIPVVFVLSVDPVGAGFVESFQKPGGNLTGVILGVQEGPRLEWLLQVVPTIKKIYVVYNPDTPGPVASLKQVQAAVLNLGVKVVTAEVRTSEEVTAAIQEIPEDIGAIFMLPDTLVALQAAEFVALNLPMSVPNVTNMADPPQLTAYGVELGAAGKQAARMADQILKGVKPADLPVEMAEFYTGINLKAAEAIGLYIPDMVLRQANIIIR